jgi:integrase
MASVHKTKAGSWSVRWREGSLNRSRNFKTKDEARRWQSIVERSEVAVPRRDEIPSVHEFCEEWLNNRPDLASGTVTQYQQWLDHHIYPPLGHLLITELTTPRLDDWQRRRLEEEAGPAVLGKAQTLLSQILDRAVVRGLLQFNPLLSLKKPAYKKRTHRWLTAEEVEAIRSWYLERDDLTSATLVSILAYVGIRPQDALALQWRDLDARLYVGRKNVNGELVEGSKQGEHYKRKVSVPLQVRADLNDLRDTMLEATLMFPDKDGRPWSRTHFDNWRSRAQERKGRPVEAKCFKRAALDCGLGWDLRPYDLRHTAATLYANSGWNHLEVARQLGHSPEVSIRVYQHLFDHEPGTNNRSVEDYIAEARGNPVRSVFVPAPGTASLQ